METTGAWEWGWGAPHPEHDKVRSWSGDGGIIDENLVLLRVSDPLAGGK